ncbi:MAG: hypothetical protein ACR2N6_03370, partial [Miltoncostaeaceae bacterium]
MERAADRRGQATVETVGLWTLMAALVLTVGALAAREVVVPAPQPRAIDEILAPLDPFDERVLALRHPGQAGLWPETDAIAATAADAARYRASLDREFAAGFLDRLRDRGRDAIEDPEALVRLVFTNSSGPAGAADITAELVSDIRRIAGMEPGDAGRAAARDVGEIAADLVLARALRGAGRGLR